MRNYPRTKQLKAVPEALRIVLLADTHELHREVDVLRADILIHAGDITMMSRSPRALSDFNDWLGELPHDWKLVVPGNHDRILQTGSAPRRLLSNATLLIDESIEVAGLHIWGSPVTRGSGPAYNMPDLDDRRCIYAQIPNDTDILITHGPPYGILDQPPDSDVNTGDPVLLEAVLRVRPKLHVFGHVHGAYGILQAEHTLFVNAALLGVDGGIEHQPIVLKLPRK